MIVDRGDRSPAAAPHSSRSWNWTLPKVRNRVPSSATARNVNTSSHPKINPNHADLKSVSSMIFITNFPHNLSSSELWNHCAKWGRVSDVYIYVQLTKSGKRFGFVRFIGVSNLQKLIDNLRSISIDSYHIYADYSWENGAKKSKENAPAPKPRTLVHEAKNLGLNGGGFKKSKTFADHFKPGAGCKLEDATVCKKKVSIHLSDCINTSESNIIIAKVMNAAVIPNLPVLFACEGFLDVAILYIGGRWVGISFPKC